MLKHNSKVGGQLAAMPESEIVGVQGHEKWPPKPLKRTILRQGCYHANSASAWYRKRVLPI